MAGMKSAVELAMEKLGKLRVQEPSTPLSDEQLVHGDLALEMSLGVERAVVVILHGDLRQGLPANAVLMEIARRRQGKPPRSGATRTDDTYLRARETAKARIFQLLKP